MALDIDGYAVLAALARSPEAFPDLRAEVAKTGRTLVVKQFKAKTLPLAGLRRIRDVLGAESFSLIVDGMTDAEVKGVLTRLDRHHPALKTASKDWLLGRIRGLAGGEEPADKPKVAKAEKKPPAAAKPKPQRALGSRPFAATWDGTDHDAPAPRGRKKG